MAGLRNTVRRDGPHLTSPEGRGTRSTMQKVIPPSATESLTRAARVSRTPATTVRLGSKTLNLSNIDKVLYPDADFTKGDVIHYYLSIAPVLLPHLKDRPITLKRYPNGVDGMFFYEKR